MPKYDIVLKGLCATIECFGKYDKISTTMKEEMLIT
jgi:hypothetical protein